MAHLSLNETHFGGSWIKEAANIYGKDFRDFRIEMLCLGLVILVTSGWFVLVGGGLKDFGNFQPEN